MSFRAIPLEPVAAVSSCGASEPRIFLCTCRAEAPTKAVLERAGREPKGRLFIPQDKRPSLARLWRSLPIELATLLSSPLDAGWLVVAEPLAMEARSRPSPHVACWEWTLRQMKDGQFQIEFLDAAARESSVSDAIPRSLPSLGPSEPAAPELVLDAVRRWPAPSDHPSFSPEQTAVQSGLLLWHDLLDESHRRSQSIEGEGRNRNGDYWHAIVHRREPDYGNSKYWFRRVGGHPIFSELSTAAAACLREVIPDQADELQQRLGAPRTWNPFAFVDLCEQAARRPHSAFAQAVRAIAWIEMALLIEQSVADAGCG